MKEQSTYYTILVTKYLSGEATAEEIRKVEQWVGEDPSNRDEFHALSKTVSLLQQKKIFNSTDTEMEWRKFRSAVPENTPVANTSLSEGRKSFFTINSERTFNPYLRIAALILALLIPAGLLYYYAESNSMVTISSTGQIMELTLPDGSLVTLNRGSEITYPGKFNKSNREVTLSGEAWFEVSHIASRPFLVTAGKTKVEVLGTKFSVSDNTESGNKEVFLESGKVRLCFTDLPENQEILTPGQVARLSESTHQIVKTINPDPNILAWKTKHLVFNNTKLGEALMVISKVYQANFKILTIPVRECRITATFDHQSLESVLNVLQATLDLQIRQQKDRWEISGKNCPVQ